MDNEDIETLLLQGLNSESMLQHLLSEINHYIDNHFTGMEQQEQEQHHINMLQVKMMLHAMAENTNFEDL